MQRTHVLIVDDDPDILRILETYFRHRGMRISTARRAAVARAIWMRDAVDLLLADARIPGENGISLTRDAADSGIRTIIMSGDLDWAVSQGADAGALLAKPFELDAAHDRVLSVLARR
jgi:two-component system phosphate regulon response regulator OmpR